MTKERRQRIFFVERNIVSNDKIELRLRDLISDRLAYHDAADRSVAINEQKPNARLDIDVMLFEKSLPTEDEILNMDVSGEADPIVNPKALELVDLEDRMV